MLAVTNVFCLYCCILEAMMRMALEGKNDLSVNICGRIVNNLRFAHDIDVIADNEGDLQRLMSDINQFSAGVGLKVNTLKINTMVISMKETNLNIKIENEYLEQVKEFTYLGVIITDDGTSQGNMMTNWESIICTRKVGGIWKDKRR